MDANRFDNLARALEPGSRRTALRALAGGARLSVLGDDIRWQRLWSCHSNLQWLFGLS